MQAGVLSLQPARGLPRRKASCISFAFGIRKVAFSLETPELFLLMWKVKHLTPGFSFFSLPNTAGRICGDGTWKNVLLTGAFTRMASQECHKNRSDIPPGVVFCLCHPCPSVTGLPVPRACMSFCSWLYRNSNSTPHSPTN